MVNLKLSFETLPARIIATGGKNEKCPSRVFSRQANAEIPATSSRSLFGCNSPEALDESKIWYTSVLFQS